MQQTAAAKALGQEEVQSVQGTRRPMRLGHNEAGSMTQTEVQSNRGLIMLGLRFYPIINARPLKGLKHMENMR